jgi:hypothetical protein
VAQEDEMNKVVLITVPIVGAFVIASLLTSALVFYGKQKNG